MEQYLNAYGQKDVVLIPFPYSDLTGAKQRPAVIVSNDKLNRTQDRICCLVTSNRPKEGILLDRFSKGKLPFKSWVKPHRLFTIHEKIIRKKLCTISDRLQDTIVESIQKYTKRVQVNT